MSDTLHPEIEDKAMELAEKYFWIFDDWRKNGRPGIDGARIQGSEHGTFKRIVAFLLIELLTGEAIADE